MPLGETARCKLSAKASACKNYLSISVFISGLVNFVLFLQFAGHAGCRRGKPPHLGVQGASFTMKMHMTMGFHSLRVSRLVLNTRWQLQLHPSLLLPYQPLPCPSEARRSCTRPPLTTIPLVCIERLSCADTTALRCAFNLRRGEHARLPLHHPPPCPPGGALRSRAVTTGSRSSFCR